VDVQVEITPWVVQAAPSVGVTVTVPPPVALSTICPSTGV